MIGNVSIMRAAASAVSSAPTAANSVLAGRYRLDARLASGGMGEVYRVEDLGSGRRVALKRMFPEHAKGPLARMFEREYHTLAGLAHPRIIEVYEYGHADGLPYYTMELLDGKDLREVAPLSFRPACRLLHDVASSLALLHARRLLHRDLSPRNVRVTGDGRCKLIDFGALCSFGSCESVVGTPPLVSPEALHCAGLDQRTDLYALGAVAYYLLTGRHAFAVTSLSELPFAWRHAPPRPSEVVSARDEDGQLLEPIPTMLDELVMSMLTLDPLGRPATAAEVMDRLIAIGGFEPEQEAMSSQSYLRSPAIVGRQRELERLDKRLLGTLERHGFSVTIEATPGMGASRLLGELALRGQLAGITPILIDAKLHRGPYGVVNELIDKLLLAAKADAARAAKTHGPMLARFSPRLAAELAIPPDDTDLSGIPGELRRRTQNALVEWLAAVCERRPLLLLVDDLQHADEGSLALLASLAREASSCALSLVFAHEAKSADRELAALRAIAGAGTAMRLRPLAQEDVRTLVRSLFGDVAHTGRLADWVHGLSGGTPQACMDLVQHLVERDVVRYADGTWVLPQELQPSELPASLAQVVAARLDRLSADGRKMAEALSVRAGALSLSRCVEIATAESIDAGYAVIEELVREGVLVQAGESYHFSHESVRELLLARLDTQRVRRLHAQLGALLSQNLGDDVHAMLDAGWHLLHGGREVEGATLLAKAGIALGYYSDEMPAAVAPLLAALEVFRKQRRPAHELAGLLGPLTLAGYYCDRRLAERFGEETVAVLERLLGITLALKLRPLLGKRLALYIGLGSAALRFLLPGRGGIAKLRRTITLFANCVTVLVGTATICFNGDRARRFAEALEPLSALGDDHAAAWTYRLARLVATIAVDRPADTLAGLERVRARFDDAAPIRDLPPDSRKMLLGGALYATGALEAFRGGHRALECAERLEKLGVRLYMMVAAQVRANYHACRGEADLARRHRERVEAYAVQSGSGWQVEIWAPCSSILSQGLTRDRIGLKHTTETLDRLCADVPSLERHAKLARATYHSTKGEHRTAEALRRPVLEAAAPRSFVGWSSTASLYAGSLRQLGQAARAKSYLEKCIALLSEEDRKVVVMTHNLFVELALAHAELGDFAGGARILDEQLRVHAGCDNPLVLGNMHCGRALVAMRAGDLEGASKHVAAMEQHYRPTANPCLIAQCEQLRRELGHRTEVRGRLSIPPPAGGRTVSRSIDRAIGAALGACRDPRDRAQRALQALLEHTGGHAGYLFALENERLRLLAPEGEPAPAEVEQQVLAALASFTLEETARTAPTDTSETSAAATPQSGAYRVLVLSTDRGISEHVVGVAAIARNGKPQHAPHPRLLRAIADALLDQSVLD
jgi:hypothetical protein